MNGITQVLPHDGENPAWITHAAADPTAFAMLYDHYFPRVYNYVRYRVTDAPTADDLTAQIFERVLLNLARYQAKRASFSAWLFGIARHVIGDHFRAQRRQRWLPFDTMRQQASPDPSPEHVIVTHEAHEKLLKAVATLKNRERDLVAMKFGGDLTNREIARLTGLSESNVGVILYRSLRKLRAVLELEEDQNHD